ncbi:hypothetical protein M422DRAFT_780394 [Sphaerobolus stellatus SS14]|uniref:L-ornithine N(5)-oxygenase n=1 Tax=Sphaerobolus stellatus (strain SS14) TaxID=990650 RepID=A0A0C9V2K1_SPHS4|nr:hypothetical protein M422DRAFT_780394 [Sphaerobolus stellatus SS14]
MSSNISIQKTEIRVIIVGAGLGGISAAIALKGKLGFTNFQIFEKASEVGGTWRDNNYPGCACDVPVHWYSHSKELKPDWSTYYAEQPEIYEYWKFLAKKYGLYSKIQFNSNVCALIWNEERQYWKAEVEHDGRKDSAIAEIVFLASGGLVLPGYASIKGIDSFEGPKFHSARWDYNVDLRGKTVGVIGNGCSSAQFIPKISEDPSVHVINFCRTPSWIVPRTQFSYPTIVKLAFRWIPFLARAHRNFLACFTDLAFFIWVKRNVRLRNFAQKLLIRYMKKTAPKEYHDVLTPNYPMGCKRIIRDPGYYEALNRPNVELVFGGVEEIVQDEIITGKGEKYKCDVLIFGTGFLFINPDVRITGRGGQDLYEYFDSRGGPEAYIGTAVPGFPNIFTILGPNIASGHVSAIFSEEQQILYALQLCKPIFEGKAKSFEVRRDVSENYNVDLQRRLDETVWTSCHSYYRNGSSNSGKVVATFPGSLLRQWYITRKVNWDAFVGVEAESWEKERKKQKFLRTVRSVLFTFTFTGIALYLWKGGLDLEKVSAAFNLVLNAVKERLKLGA